MEYTEADFISAIIEFAKLRALRAFTSHVSSCFTRFLALCLACHFYAPYLHTLFTCGALVDVTWLFVIIKRYVKVNFKEINNNNNNNSINNNNNNNNNNKKLQEACNFIKKDTLTLVFSCEFCEISKNTSGRVLLIR